MNRLLCFCLHTLATRNKMSTVIYTCREGERVGRRSVVSPELGRRLAEKLCDRYRISHRAGLYVGEVMYPTEGA